MLSALPLKADVRLLDRLVRFVPQPDLAPPSGVDEGLCRLKGDHSVRRPRDGRGSFLLAAGVFSARRRTGMRGSLGEKIGEGVFADVHAGHDE